MALFEVFRAKRESEGLKPIVQRVPLPVVQPARPSLARPAAPKPPPPPPTPPKKAEPAPPKAQPPPVQTGATRIAAPRRGEDLTFLRRAVVKQARGDNQGAIEDFTRAIEIDPGCVEAYEGRGISRDLLGDAAGAKEDYAKSITFEVRAEIRRQIS